MTETTTLKLQKPEESDISSFAMPFNPNMDKIDTFATQTTVMFDNITTQQGADAARFGVIDTQIQNIVKSITDVSNSLSTVTADLQTTNTNLGALTLEVNNIKTQVGTANSDIQALQTTTAKQTTDITTLKNWYEHLQELSDTQSNQIQTLLNDQTETSADVADLSENQTLMQNTVEQLNLRTRQIEAKTDDLGAEQARIVEVNNTQNQQIQTHNTLIINNRNQINAVRSKTETLEDNLQNVDEKVDVNSTSIGDLDRQLNSLGKTVEILEYPLEASELTRDSDGHYIASPGATLSSGTQIISTIIQTTNSNQKTNIYNATWEYTQSAQGVIIPIFKTEASGLPIWTTPFPVKKVVLNVVKK